METSAVSPLWLLNANIVRQNPRRPYEAVEYYAQCYWHPNIYIASRPRVGLFPLRRESDGYAFKRSLRLQSEEAVHKYDKGVEVAMLPDTRL